MTGSSGGPSKNRNALSIWTSKQFQKNIPKFWEQLHKIDKLTIHLPHTFEQGDMAHKQQSYEPHFGPKEKWNHIGDHPFGPFAKE